jgi:NADH:ubiquinone oxidoreductase subunit D
LSSDGRRFRTRCKIRTGCSAISIVPLVSRNLMIADLIAVIAASTRAPEIDR